MKLKIHQHKYSVYTLHFHAYNNFSSDVDSAISFAYIVSLPRRGALFQVYSNGSIAGNPLVLSSATNGTRLLNGARKIAYLYRYCGHI